MLGSKVILSLAIFLWLTACKDDWEYYISGDEDKLEMAVHGQLSAFNSTEDDWQSYTERLEFYFTANNIEDAEKRRAILLSVCGAATYKRIKSLISPSKPTEKSFDEIVQLMSDHYNPKPTATVQRCLFNARSRKPGESVAKFVAELKELAE